MTSDHDYLWSKRHEVLYGAEFSALYHRSREAFFDTSGRLANATAFTSAVAALANPSDPVWVQLSAVFTIIALAASLVVGLTDRARRHAGLATNYIMLEADIMARGERDFSEADIARWGAQLRQVEADEPATLYALATLCQNRLALAQGHPESMVPLPLHQRMLAQVWGFAPRSA